jgi:inositol-hexakisphosphate kinase
MGGLVIFSLEEKRLTAANGQLHVGPWGWRRLKSKQSAVNCSRPLSTTNIAVPGRRTLPTQYSCRCASQSQSLSRSPICATSLALLEQREVRDPAPRSPFPHLPNVQASLDIDVSRAAAPGASTINPISNLLHPSAHTHTLTTSRLGCVAPNPSDRFPARHTSPIPPRATHAATLSHDGLLDGLTNVDSMSPPSNAPKNTSPTPSVRSNATHDPAHGAPTLQPSPLPREKVTPKSLFQTGRSKTAPLGVDHIWKASAADPQLSERESIFATTYHSDSPAPSPRSPAPTADPIDNAADRGPSDMAVPMSPARRLTETSLPRQQHSTRTTSNLNGHQNLLETHFNYSRHNDSNMELGSIHQSPPPFMSPVDSPVHRPSTSQHHHVQPSTRTFLDTLAESEKRVKNRLWREGKAAPTNTSSATRTGAGSHVDKKIEATLPKVEPLAAARSRKASHYLGVFKGNDEAEEEKKREGRTKERRPTDKTHQPIQKEGGARSDSRATSASKKINPGLPRTSSDVSSPQTGAIDSCFDVVPAPGDEASMVQNSKPLIDESRKHNIPLRLLDEIRNFHNLTPGAERGSSFSRSLPTAAVEKLSGHQSKTRTSSQANEAADYFQSRRDESEDRSFGSEEEESEREQISSALYFPHRGVKSPEQIPQEEVLRTMEIESIRTRKSFSASKGPKGWDTEETVKTPQEVEISLQSQDTNQILHGDMPPTDSVSEDENKSLIWPTTEAITSAESDNESLAESSHSLRDDESSATDDLETTPAATPRRKREKAPAAPQPPAPLGAVELKPFDHQVGGHSTVYRFSRRAVCKQLNNRENEFYETVEQHHPELLDFLPRYEIFCITCQVALKLKLQQRCLRPFPAYLYVSSILC